MVESDDEEYGLAVGGGGKKKVGLCDGSLNPGLSPTTIGHTHP